MSIERKSLIIVGALWFLVGIGLSIAGINWLKQLPFGPKMITFLSIASIVGLTKGKFVLQKIAAKYKKRAEVINFNKNDIFTGWAKILGIRGAFLISLMMVMGRFLRHSSIDRPILGVIYLAVGIALLYASKVFFISKSTNLTA